jgi:hypothetical protein
VTLNSQTRSPLRADQARELSNIGKRAAPVLGARRDREHCKGTEGRRRARSPTVPPAIAQAAAGAGGSYWRGSSCRRRMSCVPAASGPARP